MKDARIEILRRLCQTDLALAEAILRTTGFKQHQPTLDNFKGQQIALQKVLAALDSQPVVLYTRGELLSWYTDARSDGWLCSPALPNGDNWEHAILQKQGYVAEINMMCGTLTIWRPDKSEIESPISYGI